MTIKTLSPTESRYRELQPFWINWFASAVKTPPVPFNNKPDYDVIIEYINGTIVQGCATEFDWSSNTNPQIIRYNVVMFPIEMIEDFDCPFTRKKGIISTYAKKSKTESDPDGIQPHQHGAKLDAGKSPVRRGLLEYFPRACLAVAEISALGASKYSWGGWKGVKGGVDRYGDAQVRHICNAAIEGQHDPAIGHLHAAEEAWNALARLELLLIEMSSKNANSNWKDEITMRDVAKGLEEKDKEKDKILD